MVMFMMCALWYGLTVCALYEAAWLAHRDESTATASVHGENFPIQICHFPSVRLESSARNWPDGPI